jgi:type I restriction enzyme M protein
MRRKQQSGAGQSRSGKGYGANLGFEEKLWAVSDKMQGHMDAAEYKHVALGLNFLKYSSDAFQERYDAIKQEPHADPEDRDEYTGENVFWVPQSARYDKLQAAAKSPEIGKVVDGAMDAIERENPSLKGVLPKDYARPAPDKQRLRELIDLIGTIELVVRDEAGLFGPKDHRSKDLLGRMYE